MLTLTRRIGEGIWIGDDIFFTVRTIRGKQVRLGFDAPRSINIQRDELYQKKLLRALSLNKKGGKS